MTGNEILSRANYMVNGDIPSEQALQGINLALDDLSIDAPRVEPITLMIPANAYTLSLPENLTSVDEVWVGNVRVSETNRILALDVTNTGIPSRYQIIGRSLRVHPTPTIDTSITLLASVGYDHISDLATSPTSLPARFHLALSYFLTYMYWSNDEEDMMMEAMQQEYEKYKYSLAQYQKGVSGYPYMEGGS